MQHYEFENWGKYNSLCSCKDCREKFKFRVGNLYKNTKKEVYNHALILEKAYFGKTFFNGIY